MKMWTILRNSSKLSAYNHLILWFGILNFLISEIVAVKCPTSCTCSWTLHSLNVNCNHQNLTASPNFARVPVEVLNLSHNQLSDFPRELSACANLVHLDLSYNHLSHLSNNDLRNFRVLKTLILAYNHIQHWLDINPNTLFINIPNLQHLSLSGNILSSFSDIEPATMLISKSLQSLELENCGITQCSGAILLKGLPNLISLNLNCNPLSVLNGLPSQSLKRLLVSNCSLQLISNYFLEGLTALEQIDLSWNTNLDADIWNSMKSETLTTLDVSYCGLKYVSSAELENLMHLKLCGNLLRWLSAEMFDNYVRLQTLDVSYNAIDNIHPRAFIEMQELTSINLGYNQISKIHRFTFASNTKLISLNLSHNIFEYLREFASNSLLEVDLSWCEITDINPNALANLYSLEKLDLSHNLFRQIPNGLNSTTLKDLNLSNCRLTSVNNWTFHQLPELTTLRLNGNQLSNSFGNDCFQENRFLRDIWLSDNPWICACSDKTFLQFYKYLKSMQTVNDIDQLKCSAPIVYYGETWQKACQLNNTSTTAGRSNMGGIFLVIMVCTSITILFICICNGIQRCLKHHRKRLNEREYREICEEMRATHLLNEEILREAGAPNAPPSNETNLPSYEDALRMPKPIRPIKSLSDLPGPTNRSKSINAHYLIQTTTTNCMTTNCNSNLDYGIRYCSEELLSHRNAERLNPIEPYRRSRQSVYKQKSTSLHSSYPSARFKSQNLQSAEQLNDFRNH